MELGVVLLGIALPFFVLWRLSRTRASTAPELDVAAEQLGVAHAEQEALYIAGDGDALKRGLNQHHLALFVPHATALGLYREVLAAVERAAPELLTGIPEVISPDVLEVNFAETLTELGRYDDALRVTSPASDIPLCEAGRRCARSWVLSLLGRPEDAVRELEGVNEPSLLAYRAEYWFNVTFAQLIAGNLDAAADALQRSRDVMVRESSRRNFYFLLARLRWAQGRRDEALSHFETAAKHRWRWQGGAGLLAWGDALKELGRDDDARAAWAQCISQDPQSLAAAIARQRI